MDLVDECRSEFLTQVSTHKFEGEEIVEDHPLRASAWILLFSEHFFRITPCGRRPLHLGGGDRFFVERIDQVSVSHPLRRHFARQLHLTARLRRNLLIQLQEAIREIKRQARSVLHNEGGGPGRRGARSAYCVPPRLAGKSLWHRLRTEVILPRPILRIIQPTSEHSNNGETMVIIHAHQTGDDTFAQLTKPIRRRDRSLHGYSVHTNFKLLLILS